MLFLRHFEPGALKAFVLHGPNRPHDPKLLTSFDVVLTTYATLAAENSSGVLHQLEWYRVVLDEGTTATLAICVEISVLGLTCSHSALDPKLSLEAIPSSIRSIYLSTMVPNRNSGPKPAGRPLISCRVPSSGSRCYQGRLRKADPGPIVTGWPRIRDTSARVLAGILFATDRKDSPASGKPQPSHYPCPLQGGARPIHKGPGGYSSEDRSLCQQWRRTQVQPALHCYSTAENAL